MILLIKQLEIQRGSSLSLALSTCVSYHYLVTHSKAVIFTFIAWLMGKIEKFIFNYLNKNIYKMIGFYVKFFNFKFKVSESILNVKVFIVKYSRIFSCIRKSESEKS